MRWMIYAGLAVVIIPAIVVLIGAALPKDHIVTRKILLSAQPEAVFALIAAPSEWRGLKYEMLVESPLKWRETDLSGDAITYERVETIARKRIVNRIADAKLPFGGSWTYEIMPSANGAELTITENGEVYNPLFRFVSRFIIGQAATIEKFQRDLVAHLK